MQMVDFIALGVGLAFAVGLYVSLPFRIWKSKITLGWIFAIVALLLVSVFLWTLLTPLSTGIGITKVLLALACAFVQYILFYLLYSIDVKKVKSFYPLAVFANLVRVFGSFAFGYALNISVKLIARHH